MTEIKLDQAAIRPCYQCGKCAAGCPLASHMDASPRQILRYLQLGQEEKALHSSSLWMCLTCYTCSARCPNGVPVADIMESLRQQAESRGICLSRRSALFNKAFLLPVRWFGRSHEITMTALYNIGSGRLLQHFSYLPAMLRGRQLKLIPSRIRDRAGFRRLLEDAAKEVEGE